MQGIITVVLLVCLVYIGVIVSRYPDGNLEAFHGRTEKRNFKRTKLWQSVCEYYGIIAANNIFPMTYVLPTDLHKFNCDYDDKKQYISKTLNSGMRKGVFLYEKGDSLDNIAVVQEYIPNPLLINGFKFDIRNFFWLNVAEESFSTGPFTMYSQSSLSTTGVVTEGAKSTKPGRKKSITISIDCRGQVRIWKPSDTTSILSART